MKSSLVILFVLIASAFASDEDEARKAIECFKQALDGGIASINLTNFNPYHHDDFSISLYEGTANYTNYTIYGLVDFNATELVAARDQFSDSVNLNYTLTWPKVRITSDYVINGTGLDRPVRAFINITSYHAQASGKFNMTGGADLGLNDFYFEPNFGHIVDSTIIYDDIEETAYEIRKGKQLLLHDVFHRSASGDYSYLSSIIQNYLNREWLVGGRDRLAVVYQHCKL